MSEQPEDMQDEPIEAVAQDAPEEIVEDIQGDGPDINDPNSDHWKDQAKSQGWSEDFTPDVDSGKFQKTAREFVNDGKFMNQLSSLKKDQENMSRQFQENTNVQLDMQRSAHKATIDDLTAQRGKAMDDFDRETVDRIDGQISTTREQMNSIPAARAVREDPRQASISRDYERDNQSWLKDLGNPTAPNYAKAQYADQIYSQAMSAGYSAEEIIRVTNDAVNQNFPTQNVQRERAPSGERSNRGGTRQTQALSYSQFSRDEQNSIDKAVSSGFYTREEAIAQTNSYRKEK